MTLRTEAPSRTSIRAFLEGPPLTPADLCAVLLVRADGEPDGRPMPTVTVAEIPAAVRELAQAGVRAVKVFAGSGIRDERASRSATPGTPLTESTRAVKETEPDMAVMTETCLCAHTASGDCYLANADGRPDVAATIELLAAQALLQAEAGADIIGPASMIPGSVREIREELDDSGHGQVSVMPHLIFDSTLYGPYRQTMSFGRPQGKPRPFQLDPRRADEATTAGLAFLREGADMLLLEPALFSVDTLRDLAQRARVPLMPFSVSGEYQRLAPVDPATGQRDHASLAELVVSLKRAGAARVITYGALAIARTLT